MCPQRDFRSLHPRDRHGADVIQDSRSDLNDAEVSIARLEAIGAVAYDPSDPLTRYFDFLRTQVLQTMQASDWRVLAVTSPTAGCGKTFNAINLTLSIARQPKGSVLLVDLDFKKPQVATRLGLHRKTGMRALLSGRSSLHDAITRVALGGIEFGVLPCERGSTRSSDLIASPAMRSLCDQLRSETEFKTIIFDLPPMLPTDDVLTILPHVDCVLLIAAVGLTKTAELLACADQLDSKPVVRVALNRTQAVPNTYGY